MNLIYPTLFKKLSLNYLKKYYTILLNISLSIFFFFLVTSILKPSILLVYFHKQLQHEFLVMWAEYLEKHHGVNAYTLYKCGGNPKKWLNDVTSKSNIIVFVISEGLAEVFDEKNSSYEEDTYWVEQLPEAKALISSLKTGEKVFCKVCFPFSKKEHVPKCLKNKGPLFRLLGKVDQTEEFLCYLFNCSAKFRFLNRLCCIKHHDIKNADSLQKDLKDLKDKLKKVNENKHDVVSGTNANEEILQNASINEQSDLTSQNDYKINETSLSVIDENEDSLAANSSSIFNEENGLKQSSLSTEDSGNKNDQFHQQGENASYLAKEQKKEFLLYCLGKAINFQ